MTRRARVLTASPLALLLALLVLASTPGPSTAFPIHTTYDRAFSAPGSGPIAVGDINGDGRTDVVAVDDAGMINVFLQNATGLAEAAVAIPGHSPTVRKLLLTDADGDGKTDIVALDPANTTIYHQSGGGFPNATIIPTPNAQDIAIGDLNGDGRPDLAFVAPDRVEIVFQGQTGVWSNNTQNLTSTSGFHSVAIADMNGDGRPDLVIAKPHDVRLYYQGPGGIPSDRFLGFPLNMDGQISLSVQDVNGDRKPDLVISATNPLLQYGVVSLFTQDGGPFNETATSTVAGPLTGLFAVGDVNDDGRPDLVTAAYSSPFVVAYAQELGGGFGVVPVFTLPVGMRAAGIAIGRFTGHQFNDLILRVTGYLLLYGQEDSPPALIRTVPDVVMNEGSPDVALLDLRNYFSDDHNALRFEVSYQERPQDVSGSIAPDGHHMNFTARAGWYGRARFRVVAADLNPANPSVESNNFTVMVNALPYFTSSPPGEAPVGQAFLYQVAVADPYPLNDSHTFSLPSAPDGMTIDPQTGLVQWTPVAADAGGHAVSIRVTDAYGATAEQSFELRVIVPPTPTPMGVYVIVAVLATLGSLGIGTLVSENFKWSFLMVFLPLYSKIKREQVLDHFVRGQIYGYILANPGEHYNAIKAALDLTNGSLAHHLKTLEREQFVKSKRFGLYRRFYPMNMRIPDDGFFAPNEIQKTVLDIIRTNPGITQKEIADHLGLTPPTVNYHIGILSENRAIRVERAGRKTHCYIADALPDGATGPAGGPPSGAPRPGAPRP